MNTLDRACEYCSHRNSAADARCGHCGAPLRVIDEAVHRIGKVAERELPAAEKVVRGLEEGAAASGEAVKKVAGKVFPAWQWKAALGASAVMVLLVVLILRSCSLSMPSMGNLTPVDAVPELRAAATCQSSQTGGGEACTVAADDPLLAGGITGGRPLTFTIRTDSPEQAAASIGRWRSSGGAIVSESPAFVAISSSVTVWYADSQSGLHLETSAFANRAGAQTFLFRSGLVR